jgi:isopenicillin-N epimerase
MLRNQFLLRPDITYLNFGAFGACPKPVFQQYQQLQLELEQEPSYFMNVAGPQYLKESKKALAQYVNAHEDDLVYVSNPSFAANIVAKNFPLKQNDEVLATNIEYGACDRTWEYYCKKSGAVYKRQNIQLPIESKESFVQNFLSGLTDRTRLIFISHITSSTGLRLPVEEISSIAKEKNIPVFIDGAHAPGQIPVDLSLLDVDFYTCACHKWMMTPKGCSFLYVKKEWQNSLEPLAVSWGYNAIRPSHSQFLDYHQIQGTRDYTAFLTVPRAINFMKENNWEEVSSHYQQMTQSNAPGLCKLFNTKPIAPISNDFVAQLYSAEVKTKEPEKLHNHFYEKYKIQIPVMYQNGKTYLRYSLNAFNEQGDLDKLFDAIKEIKTTTNLIDHN